MMPELIENLPSEKVQKLKWIFTDVDDTLTFHGQLIPETLQALAELKQKGIQVVAVTGACAGWCDQMAKLWPLHAVIGENGAFWLKQTEQGFERSFSIPFEMMQKQQNLLIEAIKLVLVDYPDVHLAQDQAFRFCDVAIDIGQERPKLDQSTCDEIVARVRSLNIDGQQVKATCSSIHINVWIGEHSKRSASEDFLKQVTNGYLSLDAVAYIGDSLNDESMFEWLNTTVGVANIAPYLPQLASKPTYITQAEGGKGFNEFVKHLVALA